MVWKASYHPEDTKHYQDFGEDPYDCAVMLKDQLQNDDSQWGFVIYRCTYKDDSKWHRFMDILNTSVRESLDESSLSTAGRRLAMERLNWDVQDDKETLEGATIDTIRERYKRYRKPKAPGPAHILTEADKGWTGPLSTEHHFCIRVNEASLKSVLGETPLPPHCDWSGPGYVDLIDVDWELPERLEEDSEEEYQASLDGGREPMEGYTLDELPWRCIAVDGMMPHLYMDLYEPYRIKYYYQRPPDVNVCM